MNAPSRRLEIVATTLDDARAAARGGAQRLELCADLSCGGLTPARSFLDAVRAAHPDLDLRVLLRPHGGPFRLSAAEVDALEREARAAREIGVQGIVVGALDAAGRVDREAMARLREAARPLEATFHRAFDEIAERGEALELLIALGFERVLSSGGASSAWLGRERLRSLVAQSAGRIGILPGGGVRAAHAAELIASTGAHELHSSARTSAAAVDEAEVCALAAALR